VSIIRDLAVTVPSLLVIPVGLAIVKRFAEQTDSTTTPKPLIPVPVTPAPVVKPTTYAKPAKPITPFITVQQRAEQAAFQRKQEAMTRAELLRIGPSGYRSL
jgi:hypothetical protein